MSRRIGVGRGGGVSRRTTKFRKHRLKSKELIQLPSKKSGISRNGENETGKRYNNLGGNRLNEGWPIEWLEMREGERRGNAQIFLLLPSSWSTTKRSSFALVDVFLFFRGYLHPNQETQDEKWTAPWDFCSPLLPSSVILCQERKTEIWSSNFTWHTLGLSIRDLHPYKFA